MTIYERIKALRCEKNMSQLELARKVGYEGRSAISKVEKGERDISQSMIEKYAAALGVSPYYLLYGEEEPREDPKPVVRMKLSPEEEMILNAYRSADEGIRDAVAKLLDVQREKEGAAGSSVASGM